MAFHWQDHVSTHLLGAYILWSPGMYVANCYTIPPIVSEGSLPACLDNSAAHINTCLKKNPTWDTRFCLIITFSHSLDVIRIFEVPTLFIFKSLCLCSMRQFYSICQLKYSSIILSSWIVVFIFTAKWYPYVYYKMIYVFSLYICTLIFAVNGILIFTVKWYTYFHCVNKYIHLFSVG